MILTRRGPPFDSQEREKSRGEKKEGAGEGRIYRRKDGRRAGQYEAEGKRRYVYGSGRETVSAKPTKAIGVPVI